MTPNILTDRQKSGKISKYSNSSEKDEELKTDPNWKCLDHIIWPKVLFFIGLHVSAAYGAYVLFTDLKIQTIFWTIFVYVMSGLGIGAGVHRLWSHRAYKAKLPFRIFLAICNSIAYQTSIFSWARDHRVHHKYTETDADPHNSKRGFFFAHVGWLMCKKHPDIKRFGAKVDCSDMMADPVVAFQHKYYWQSVFLFCFFIPSVVPWLLWSESIWNAFFVCGVLRYTLGLNAALSANSFAHMYGYKPYDIKIAPVENVCVSAVTLGEGFHNFHHTFPWDYSTSEWGGHVNLATCVLDLMAKVGMVYDRRVATKDIIEKRKLRTGPQTDNYIVHELDY